MLPVDGKNGGSERTVALPVAVAGSTIVVGRRATLFTQWQGVNSAQDISGTRLLRELKVDGHWGMAMFDAGHRTGFVRTDRGGSQAVVSGPYTFLYSQDSGAIVDGVFAPNGKRVGTLHFPDMGPWGRTFDSNGNGYAFSHYFVDCLTSCQSQIRIIDALGRQKVVKRLRLPAAVFTQAGAVIATGPVDSELYGMLGRQILLLRSAQTAAGEQLGMVQIVDWTSGRILASAQFSQANDQWVVSAALGENVALISVDVGSGDNERTHTYILRADTGATTELPASAQVHFGGVQSAPQGRLVSVDGDPHGQRLVLLAPGAIPTQNARLTGTFRTAWSSKHGWRPELDFTQGLTVWQLQVRRAGRLVKMIRGSSPLGSARIRWKAAMRLHVGAYSWTFTGSTADGGHAIGTLGGAIGGSFKVASASS